ncbi:A24 family peptidase [Streptomyces sp. NPDC051940]|uniref:A24 family peptidase n=1 Tax=Streptomyces sp. NPDC051940 TaxID=3155675 RepID=UPI0034273CDA
MSIPALAALVTAAALWGACVGALAVPRAAHRLAVEPGEPWRAVRGVAFPVHEGVRPGVVTGITCGVLAAAAGAEPELAVWLLTAPVCVVLVTVDIRVRRLPDVLTLPLAGAVALLLGGAALIGSAGSWTRALLGGLALGGAYLLLWLINPGGLGFGDVKLAFPLGMALGWYSWGILVTGAFAGFVLGALYGVGLIVSRRGNRRTALPFGPFMAIGALGGVCLGAIGVS